MIKKFALKAARSVIKILLPFVSKILICLRINRRVANYLNHQSFLANNCYNFSKFIEKLNINEKIIALDVGAQGGFNADGFFSKRYEKFFEIIMVEPIKEEAEKLKKKFKYVIDKGLWSSNKKKSIYILKNRLGSSSMYEPNPSSFEIHSIKEKDYNSYEVTKKTEIDCETLDHTLHKINVKIIDYLKLDTQGAELEILKGMKNYKPLVIKLEAHIFSMYKEVPAWSELMDHLNKLGYMVCDWKGIGSHATRIPAEMDIVFIPNIKKEDGINLINRNENKFISLMLMFGYLDLLKIIARELKLKSYENLDNYKDRFFF